MSTNILLAGATGVLGERIASGLLGKPGVNVRLLVREETLSKNNPGLAALHASGAEIVAGDLLKPRTLPAAVAGTDIVISAVQGLRETIIDGQLALLDAAKRGGVRRFIPSDFAIDLFRLAPGEHAAMDLRREADATIARSGLEYVHVLNGAFMEVLAAPFFEAFDFEKRTASYWGDGETPLDITAVDDVARYTVAAALDPALPSGKFAIAGDRLTMRQAIATAERVFGAPFAVEVRGTINDLERHAEQVAKEADDVWSPMFPRFQLIMARGTGQLTDIANDRYPEIRPISFETFLRATVMRAAA